MDSPVPFGKERGAIVGHKEEICFDYNQKLSEHILYIEYLNVSSNSQVLIFKVTWVGTNSKNYV